MSTGNQSLFELTYRYQNYPRNVQGMHKYREKDKVEYEKRTQLYKKELNRREDIKKKEIELKNKIKEIKKYVYESGNFAGYSDLDKEIIFNEYARDARNSSGLYNYQEYTPTYTQNKIDDEYKRTVEAGFVDKSTIQNEYTRQYIEKLEDDIRKSNYSDVAINKYISEIHRMNVNIESKNLQNLYNIKQQEKENERAQKEYESRLDFLFPKDSIYFEKRGSELYNVPRATVLSQPDKGYYGFKQNSMDFKIDASNKLEGKYTFDEKGVVTYNIPQVNQPKIQTQQKSDFFIITPPGVPDKSTGVTYRLSGEKTTVDKFLEKNKTQLQPILYNKPEQYITLPIARAGIKISDYLTPKIPTNEALLQQATKHGVAGGVAYGFASVGRGVVMAGTEFPRAIGSVVLGSEYIIRHPIIAATSVIPIAAKQAIPGFVESTKERPLETAGMFIAPTIVTKGVKSLNIKGFFKQSKNIVTYSIIEDFSKFSKNVYNPIYKRMTYNPYEQIHGSKIIDVGTGKEYVFDGLNIEYKKVEQVPTYKYNNNIFSKMDITEYNKMKNKNILYDIETKTPPQNVEYTPPIEQPKKVTAKQLFDTDFYESSQRKLSDYYNYILEENKRVTTRKIIDKHGIPIIEDTIIIPKEDAKIIGNVVFLEKKIEPKTIKISNKMINYAESQSLRNLYSDPDIVDTTNLFKNKQQPKPLKVKASDIFYKEKYNEWYKYILEENVRTTTRATVKKYGLPKIDDITITPKSGEIKTIGNLVLLEQKVEPKTIKVSDMKIIDQDQKIKIESQTKIKKLENDFAPDNIQALREDILTPKPSKLTEKNLITTGFYETKSNLEHMKLVEMSPINLKKLKTTSLSGQKTVVELKTKSKNKINFIKPVVFSGVGSGTILKLRDSVKTIDISKVDVGNAISNKTKTKTKQLLDQYIGIYSGTSQKQINISITSQPTAQKSFQAQPVGESNIIGNININVPKISTTQKITPIQTTRKNSIVLTPQTTSTKQKSLLLQKAKKKIKIKKPKKHGGYKWSIENPVPDFEHTWDIKKSPKLNSRKNKINKIKVSGVKL